MDFEALGPRGASLRMAWRAALIGAFASGAVWLIAATHLYATAVLALLIVALTTADLGRLIARVSRPRGDALESPGPARLARERSITDQRQIECLQSLLDTVAAALIVVRPDERILLANRAARRLAAQPVGRLTEVTAVGPAAARALLELRAGARSVVPLPDGGRAFASVSEFSGPEQERLRLIALQRVTEELDAVELDAWHEMAQVLAHEMMNSLTPIASPSESVERLIRSSIAAPPGDATRGEVVTHRSVENHAHAALLGSAQLRESAEILDALEAIRRRSTGLIDFVGRYRAVADLPRPQLRQVRLAELIGGVGRLFSARLGERGIAYSESVEPADLTVRADPQLLEQALINLLRNAADAVTGVTAPRIDVICRGGAEQVAIEIADNGCGIPRDRRDRIFVPFFTTKPGGSGIGLNLARQIALAHGGRLELRPNQPAGSVFTLALPADRTVLPADGTALPTDGTVLSATHGSAASAARRGTAQ